MIEDRIENTELKTKPNIAKRIFAVLFDYTIIFLLTFVLLLTFGEPNNEGGYTVEGFLALLPMLFWGAITVGVEQWFGTTFGNYLVGLKPVSILNFTEGSIFNEINEKLTFGQSLKRHLLDPIDMFFFGLVGIITIKSTKKHQRLGDIWDETVVVENFNRRAIAKGLIPDACIEK